MLGDLNKGEMISLLESQVTGRLGCHSDGETYVVPINYVYRNNAIYAHSGPGKKIDMLRRNPQVCFQVDQIKDIFSWKSVVLWGTFEELNGEERQQAMQGIIHRIMPLTYRPSQESSHGISSDVHQEIIVYKISIKEGTGRFEEHDEL
ncbi:pyridoxamine 5'-phosphate oxidase family protein [Pedobacter sp. HDW13]|uniref:pyridoxamine 5'-phosphate oxidase family protein n=1 Tax=unclassified Pedobacter TaxID=2628915 RepID=UPI000F5A5E75|nr:MULTISPECIES: pyridoxamine 5'-phosphate oxidase family protein [unclassified Pedobacter]QIL41528.1 pyridoxamine 5'-phosphate oxidase family protein [Pedobacter sp. HDW13]RQO77898.1 pyridoxamine 5'-phosphate oxidase [Pedobacter sp. KBW01]